MISALLNWLDHRTGIRHVMHEALYERIPGGARWRYVWGSTLVFAFVTQVITGIVLWMCYSPSGQTAWESVYYIQYEMQGGWLLRGLHHFMAQAMVILLALHLLQVVIDGAYRAPREVNFWLGLILMQIVLGLSLTGYLLPWDQKGYWATRVATNLMGIVPVVGPSLQKLVVGGSEYGHHTLTRFFAVHAGVLPAALVGFLVLHVTLFRKHGLHVKDPKRRADCYFWPDQVLKDAVACLAVLAIVLLFIVRGQIVSLASGTPTESSPSSSSTPAEPHWGAELGAPADPSKEYSAARPEWYFLFLFQFLKLFDKGGETGELIGAILIPGAVMGLLFLMPILGRWKLGHRFNVGLLIVLLAGVAVLTAQAMREDRASVAYQEAVADAEDEQSRARELASAPAGIPIQGAVHLLRNDSKTAGRILFQRYCASCHDYRDNSGKTRGIVNSKPSAPNLFGFGSRAWLGGLLDKNRVASPEFFGSTRHKDKEDGMVAFVRQTLNLKRTELADVVIALSAEAKLKSQTELDRQDKRRIEAGRGLIAGKAGCTDCHQYRDAGSPGIAPDLNGYGSREWLLGMVSNPNHERFYGYLGDTTLQEMPAFVADPKDPDSNILSEQSLGLIVDWLRGDWYEPE